MKLNSVIRYLLRFTLLQVVLSYATIFFFDYYLIPNLDLFPDQRGYTFRNQIDANLAEDAERFFPWIDSSLIKLDFVLIGFIFIFLIFLYSTKFYTYVNELSFSLDRNYLDEYFSLYLIWTSSLMVFVTIFRFANLISRSYLIAFTFIVPLILLLFRNAEFLSSLFGRVITNEQYLTFNLKEDSVFRNLRIMTFRKKLSDETLESLDNTNEVIMSIDKINKQTNVNLVVFNFEGKTEIQPELEKYLVNLNKKVLIISKKEIAFKSLFISRTEDVNGYKLTYFNNDIQYGSKYILKRSLDVLTSLLALVVLIPLSIFTAVYIYTLDKGPVVIKQKRVGLHGSEFNMYKFRTMKQDSHSLREDLRDLNQNDDAIFKIDNDPRIIKGAEFLRKYSIDELPQFINVLMGQMSVVGPRPLFSEDTELFDNNYMRRLNVLPGITGLLQINERNTSDFSTWYKYDIEYIDNWSFLLDIKIIIKTPFSLLKKEVKGL
jgi:lipopolysaccharide/colanic/teichoic acid biosynthesis glycosyltransferase